MSLSHSDSWLAIKGDVRSTLVLRVDNFILGTQKGSIASEKTQFFRQNWVLFFAAFFAYILVVVVIGGLLSYGIFDLQYWIERGF
jgi:hypothetical protein